MKMCKQHLNIKIYFEKQMHFVNLGIVVTKKHQYCRCFKCGEFLSIACWNDGVFEACWSIHSGILL